jgi:hypothetical protein
MMKDVVELLKDMEYRIRFLEDNISLKYVQIPSDGVFAIPTYTADPASPVEGQMWRNSTSNQVKVYNNGVIRVINTTP